MTQHSQLRDYNGFNRRFLNNLERENVTGVLEASAKRCNRL